MGELLSLFPVCPSAVFKNLWGQLPTSFRSMCYISSCHGCWMCLIATCCHWRKSKYIAFCCCWSFKVWLFDFDVTCKPLYLPLRHTYLVLHWYLYLSFVETRENSEAISGPYGVIKTNYTGYSCISGYSCLFGPEVAWNYIWLFHNAAAASSSLSYPVLM